MTSPRRSGTTSSRLAEWEASAFTALRLHRDATTPVDDELPDDPLTLLLGSPAERAGLRQALRLLL